MKEQLARHSVALVSLTVALSSLAYNTWRNEQTEANRNVRVAGIELLLKLGELDRIVFHSHYDHDAAAGNPRSGWALVLTARDLGTLMHEPATGSTDGLFATWDNDWRGLGRDDEAVARISQDIDRARSAALKVLARLD